MVTVLIIIGVIIALIVSYLIGVRMGAYIGTEKTVEVFMSALESSGLSAVAKMHLMEMIKQKVDNL